MPNNAQQKKRLRQDEKRRARNRWEKTRLRSQLKKTLTAIDAGNKEQALQEFQVAAQYLDKASKRGVIHDNQAARRKSRLQKKINAIGS